jgi:hypothetical protein
MVRNSWLSVVNQSSAEGAHLQPQQASHLEEQPVTSAWQPPSGCRWCGGWWRFKTGQEGVGWFSDAAARQLRTIWLLATTQFSSFFSLKSTSIEFRSAVLMPNSEITSKVATERDMNLVGERSICSIVAGRDLVFTRRSWGRD